MKTLPIVALTLLLVMPGCAIVAHTPGLNLLYSGPTKKETKKVDAAQIKTDTALARIEAFQKSLAASLDALQTEKIALGAAYVYGVGNALSFTTDITPPVALARELTAMAAQTLPKPETARVEQMDQAVADRLSASANTEAQGAKELKAIADRVAFLEGKTADLTKTAETRTAAAQKAYEVDLTAERAKSQAAAVKANRFDEANSLWGSVKLFFHNGFKIVTILIVLAVLGALVWAALKLYGMANPAVGLGVNAVGRAASSTVSAAFSEVVAGGERFKSYIEGSSLAADTKAIVLDLFSRGQVESQSSTTQATVSAMTAPIVQTAKTPPRSSPAAPSQAADSGAPALPPPAH